MYFLPSPKPNQAEVFYTMSNWTDLMCWKNQLCNMWVWCGHQFFCGVIHDQRQKLLFYPIIGEIVNWGNWILFNFFWRKLSYSTQCLSLLAEIKLEYSMPGPNVPLAMCLASKHNSQYYGAKNWHTAISWSKLLVKKRVVIRGTPKKRAIFVMTFAMRRCPPWA